MHAIVCMKFYKNSNTNSILSASMYDNSALGLVLKMKQTFVDRVSVLCMGPQSIADLLKDCISFGVDEVYLISDPLYAGSDSLITSKILSEGLRYINNIDPFQFIVCGNRTDDSGTGQVGPGIADRLGYFFIPNVQGIQLQEEKYIIKTKESEYIVNASFVVSVEDEFKLPFPTMTDIFRARRKEVSILTNGVLKLQNNQVGYDASPTKVIRVEDSDFKQDKECIILNGSTEDIARQILRMSRQYTGDVK